MIMGRTIVTKVQKRFGDIDVFGHVNNIHQQEYLDLGKTDYYMQVIGFDLHFDTLSLVIVSVKTDFVGQLLYSDDTFVRTAVAAIGNKSITLSQQIVCRTEDGGEVVRTTSESVVVGFDRTSQQTVAIPREWRERIEAEL